MLNKSRHFNEFGLTRPLGQILPLSLSPHIRGFILVEVSCKALLPMSSHLSMRDLPSALMAASTKNEPVPSPAQGVGQVYRPDGEKPRATVSKTLPYENVHV